MIARREPLAAGPAAVVSDQYLVAFGKSGGLGCFTVLEPLELNRGDPVVVRTTQGLEVGEILGPATLRQARLIGSQASGDIVRRRTSADDSALLSLREQADALYEAARAAAERLGLTLQIVDAEILLDDRRAIVLFLGGSEEEVASLALALQSRQSRELRFANLAAAGKDQEEEHEHGGCGKPDCGKTEGGGGCTSCSTGGCSSCGSSKVDLKPYFEHLRTKMEDSHRTPLL